MKYLLLATLILTCVNLYLDLSRTPTVIEKSFVDVSLDKRIKVLEKAYLNVDVEKLNRLPEQLDVVKIGKIKETKQIFAAVRMGEFYGRRVFVRTQTSDVWVDFFSQDAVDTKLNEQLENALTLAKDRDDFACGDCYTLPEFSKEMVTGFFGLTR